MAFSGDSIALNESTTGLTALCSSSASIASSPSGAGKTTLFNLVAGKDLPDTGVIKIGKTVNLAYIDQNRYFPKDEKSVWETLSNGQDLIKIGKFEMSSRAYLSRFNFKGPDHRLKSGLHTIAL